MAYAGHHILCKVSIGSHCRPQNIVQAIHQRPMPVTIAFTEGLPKTVRCRTICWGTDLSVCVADHDHVQLWLLIFRRVQVVFVGIGVMTCPIFGQNDYPVRGFVSEFASNVTAAAFAHLGVVPGPQTRRVPVDCLPPVKRASSPYTSTGRWPVMSQSSVFCWSSLPLFRTYVVS